MGCIPRFCQLKKQNLKSNNIQYNTVGQWVDRMIGPPSDGPMFILMMMMMIRGFISEAEHTDSPSLPYFGKVGQYFFLQYIYIYYIIILLFFFPDVFIFQFIFCMLFITQADSSSLRVASGVIAHPLFAGRGDNHFGLDVFHVCFLVGNYLLLQGLTVVHHITYIQWLCLLER